MDSSTAWFDEFREWAEALAGALAAVVFVVAAVVFVVGGVVLPGLLDEVCPALFDALGLVCTAGLFVGGPAWLLTRR